KGIGFSFYKSNLSFTPLLSGGGQQSGLRSGTENALGVKSVALALSDLVKVDVKKNLEQRKKLVDFLLVQLQDLGGVFEDKSMASNTIYFYLNNCSSDIALALFDINGIEISA